MIKKRLLSLVKGSQDYIYKNVWMQWLALLTNIAMMSMIALLIQRVYDGLLTSVMVMQALGVFVVLLVMRGYFIRKSVVYSDLSSRQVKKTLRQMIFEKLGKLGKSYDEQVATSEVVQVAVEGVDQLETYFGMYVPQFIYALLAPLTLFVYLSFVDFKSALILFVCVPLIPLSIMAVQKFAKKLLAKYWGQYTKMGDSFLENLEGLTTLKIYGADEFKNEEMNVEAENFRKVTMRVLVMQLNSISVMDLVAYGGAALGIYMAVNNLANGVVNLYGAILIILLSADFFLPMRTLGSYFHIAMNGMAASDKIFRLLDLEEREEVNPVPFPSDSSIKVEHVNFAYEESRQILKDVNMEFPQGNFTAIVGLSGSGKSTVAGLLDGRLRNYEGLITVGGVDLQTIEEASLMEHILYIGFGSYLFKGTVRENLLMANANLSDEEMYAALEKVNLKDFILEQGGLDMVLLEKAGNLSGGQAQRLALARALLKDVDLYIFDEATSNIDAESEADIMKVIEELASRKTVVMITHRLVNATNADCVYVMQDGRVVECGNVSTLTKVDGPFSALWKSQMEMENYGKENSHE